MKEQLLIKVLEMLVSKDEESTEKSGQAGSDMIGQEVVIRTYSAGVWFGTLEEKSRNEVILKDARRMWRWWAAKSISLSAVVKYGINQEKSKIAPSIEKVWLEAIEIMPIYGVPAKSIRDAEEVEQS
jgi:hypothetical protein